MSKKEIKKDGEKFWDSNPCGGSWITFKKRLDWYIKTEPYILEYINNDLLKNKRVLDDGCGQGLILSLIAQKCRKVVGVDISKKSLIRAKQGIKELGLQNVELIQGDAENLPLKDETFDVVYSIGVLHHTPDTQKGIDEIYRVLKNDGQAIVMLYHKFNPKWLAVIILRKISKITDIINRQNYFISNKIKKSANKKNEQGTALLELFGCPVLKMYSSRQAKKFFNKFNYIKIKYHQSGFERLSDFLPKSCQRLFRPLLKLIDKITKNIFGFYMVIEAHK